MSDPIREALSSVDVDEPDDVQEASGDRVAEAVPDDHGAGDRDDDGLEELVDDDQEASGFDVRNWARRVPDGSHRDWDPSDLWDPDGGGETRLAYHLADAAGANGAGLPNGLGVLLAMVEIYYRLAKGELTLGSDDDEEEADLYG